MFARALRHYWYPGMKGYKFFRINYKKKLATLDSLDSIDDTLNPTNMPQVYSSIDGYIDPVVTILERMKFSQNIDLSAECTAFLCFNAAKTENYDKFLWREIEFFIFKNIRDMDSRMIYGCVYGMLRSNNFKLELIESLLKEFNSQCIDEFDAYQCFEMIEAISFNKREDYSATDFLHDVIMPKLEKMWRTSRFLFIDEYLLKLMLNLAKLEYYEPWVWEKMFGIIKRKRFKKLDKWEIFYKALNALREAGIEQEGKLSLNESIEWMEELWRGNVDFQWKYNLAEKRYFTVNELIGKVEGTGVDLKWEDGEKFIKHNLPKWYWEMDLGLQGEVSGLYEEYQKAIKDAKKNTSLV